MFNRERIKALEERVKELEKNTTFFMRYETCERYGAKEKREQIKDYVVRQEIKLLGLAVAMGYKYVPEEKSETVKPGHWQKIKKEIKK